MRLKSFANPKKNMRESLIVTAPSLDDVVLECPPRVWEVAVLIPGRVIPNTLKMILMAVLFGAQR